MTRPGAAIIGITLVVAASVGWDLRADDYRGHDPVDRASASGLHVWDPPQVATLRSLWIGSLPPPPVDPTNAVADDPRAVALGRHLFFDTRLSANEEVACATCHQPERAFTDGRPRAKGVGVADRRSMTIVGAAYSPWLFWDGRKDSLWSQALGPLESLVEHGGTRMQYVHLLTRDDGYRAGYQALFGPLPDLSDRSRFPESAGPLGDPSARAAWRAMSPGDRETVTRIFVNLGKAIAAHERRILPAGSRFDDYVQALLAGERDALSTILTDDETAGLRLFIGAAQCTRCHNGPLFTNNEFHNTGVPNAPGLSPDHGRMLGVERAHADPFNCLGRYSDGAIGDCAELRFARTGEGLDGAFRTPTLRNVTNTGPYMHAGQFATLGEVLVHYNEAPQGPLGHKETTPLHLGQTEIAQLEAFLGTLLATDPPEGAATPPADRVELHDATY